MIPSAGKPLREIGSNELLYAFAAGEAQPQIAVLAFDVHVDIEEGAAQPFADHPFGH